MLSVDTRLTLMLPEVPGYKALMVDKDTMRICSTLFGRTELAEHSVVHVERLDTTDSKQHLELKVGAARSSCRAFAQRVIANGWVCSAHAQPMQPFWMTTHQFPSALW